MVSKKKVVGLVLFGGVLPLVLTGIGLPNYLVIIISLSISSMIDALVIYKTVRYLLNKFPTLLGTKSGKVLLTS